MVYTLKTKTAAEAMGILRRAFRNVDLTAGKDPQQLIVWTRPADHEKIASAIENLDQAEPEETAPSMVVYTVQTITAAQAMTATRCLRLRLCMRCS